MRDSKSKFILSVIAMLMLIFGTYYCSQFLGGRAEMGSFGLRFGRVLEIADQFDSERYGNVVAFGASDIALNFSPTQIERRLNERQIKIADLGVIMGGPDHTREVTRRFASHLKQTHQRIKIGILGFRAMMFTWEYRAFMSRAGGDFTKYYKDSVSMRDFLSEPIGKTDAYVQRKLFAFSNQGVGSDVFRTLLNSDIFFPGRGLAYRNTSSKIWRDVASGIGNVQWDEALGGEINLYTKDRITETNAFLEHNREEIYRSGFESHIYMYNQTELHFTADAFVNLSGSIEDLKSVADKVVVIFIPDAIQTGYPDLSKDAKFRLSEVLSEFRRRRDIVLINLEDLKLEPSDYFDLVHFTISGKLKYNERIATEIGALLN